MVLGLAAVGTFGFGFADLPAKYASISDNFLPCVSGRMKRAKKKPIIDTPAKNHCRAYAPPKKSNSEL